MRLQEEGLVPFHPFRHLGQVADLIAEAFAGELGPWAHHTLRRMRRIARWGILGALLWATELEQESPGFVWVEDGRVVGNVSFRRAAAEGGWMIGNVAVHPQWRGRSIGRRLMEAALEEIARQGGTWVGLEVREDNPAAVHLYTQLGFETVGHSLELCHPAGDPWPTANSPQPALRRARAADSSALYLLAREGLSRSHQEVLEIRRSAYRAGWEAVLSAWLMGRWENWWVTGDSSVGALRITSFCAARWHEVEILVHPQQMDEIGPALVNAAVNRLSRRASWAVVTALPGIRTNLEPYLAHAGFRPFRRLLQMRRVLGTPVNIRIVG